MPWRVVIASFGGKVMPLFGLTFLPNNKALDSIKKLKGDY
jgi:hypothetical protein